MQPLQPWSMQATNAAARPCIKEALSCCRLGVRNIGQGGTMGTPALGEASRQTFLMPCFLTDHHRPTDTTTLSRRRQPRGIADVVIPRAPFRTRSHDDRGVPENVHDAGLPGVRAAAGGRGDLHLRRVAKPAVRAGGWGLLRGAWSGLRSAAVRHASPCNARWPGWAANGLPPELPALLLRSPRSASRRPSPLGAGPWAPAA